MLNICILGGAGYIGSVVSKRLAKTHKITVIDRYLFPLNDTVEAPITKLVKDIRSIDASDLKGYDIVVDLCGLSNDPCGDLDPDLTISINQKGRMHAATCAKNANVSKYIFCSSCSVYGFNPGMCTEKTEPKPLTLYAESCLAVEEHLHKISSQTFQTEIFRFGTAYGYSPRLRLDLVVQLMIKSILNDKRVIVTGGGEQSRPIVAVNTIAETMSNFIDLNLFNGFQISNLLERNVKIKSLAHEIASIFPTDTEVVVLQDDADKRDYLATANKLEKRIGYSLNNKQFNNEVAQLSKKMKTIDMTAPHLVTVKWYKMIIDIEKNISNCGNLTR